MIRNYVIVSQRMAEELNKIEPSENDGYEWSIPFVPIQRKRGKLVGKIPMSNTVIDDQNQVFHYYFIDGKIVYEFFCNVINTHECPNQSK